MTHNSSQYSHIGQTCRTCLCPIDPPADASDTTIYQLCFFLDWLHVLSLNRLGGSYPRRSPPSEENAFLKQLPPH